MYSESWGDLAIVEYIRRIRTRQPRKTGLTMVIDTGLGLHATADILEMSGAEIDLWKLSFGTSVFVPAEVLSRKLALINERGIVTFPGGTLFEAAIIQQNCRVYMSRARELGFRAVEISDGTISLPLDRRRRVIECARDAGVIPFSEVGKKDPAAQPPPEAVAEQALLDLEWGAELVVLEGRESGRSVGVFSETGDVDMTAVDVIAELVGVQQKRLLWEAPMKKQQAALIERFGINVNLGNVNPRQALAVESLRAGLRFETLKPLVEELAQTGHWRPDELEPLVEPKEAKSDG